MGSCEKHGEKPQGDGARHAALDSDGWRGCLWENVDCFMTWDPETFHLKDLMLMIIIIK